MKNLNFPDSGQYYFQQQEEKADHRFLDQLYEYQQNKFIDRNFDKRPNEPFKCECEVCKIGIFKHPQMNLRMKTGFNPQIRSQPINQPTSVISGNSNNIVEKDFVFILRKLQPPNKNVRTLRLQLPEMFCLNGGEVKFLVQTAKVKFVQFDKKEKIDKRDCYTLKFTKQREKLTYSHLRKFLSDKFIFQQIKLQVDPDQNQKQSSSFIQIESQSQSANQWQPNQNQNIFLNDPIETKALENKFREAVLVRFNDNNVQVLAQFEFLMLMMKRRTDPFWSQIQYVQNYVLPKKSNFELIRVEFDHSTFRWHQNFDRARIEMLYLNGDISKASEDYIPTEKEEEFEKQLTQTEFCEYQTFKIFHYIEVFSQAKILTGTFMYMLDFYDNYNLVNCQNICAVESQKRPSLDQDAAVLQNKSKKLESYEEIQDTQSFRLLLNKERHQASLIYKDLIQSDENSTRQIGNYLKRNILKVSGEDFTLKKQQQIIKQNFATFTSSINPLSTLRELVYSHQTDEEKRKRILKKMGDVQEPLQKNTKMFKSIPGAIIRKFSSQIYNSQQKFQTHGTYALLPRTTSPELFTKNFIKLSAQNLKK